MRIIAGDKRGKTLLAPDDKTIRPTSDKARGAIFNILAHAGWAPPLFLEEQATLDVFCGTGACGLEALSRGMGRACFIDAASASLDLARANAGALVYTEKCLFHAKDARLLPRAMQPYELAFLDPPYRKGLILPTLQALAEKNWLAPGAVVVAESAHDETLVPPAGFAVTDDRRYGAARVFFMLYRG